jgi:hypothetical protein
VRLPELIEDESGALSSARCGLWVTVLLAIITIALDISRHTPLPNAVYSLEATMFMAFASWAAGPRIAQYIGPQIGQAAQGVASANRDTRFPSREDDERHGGV